MAKKEGKKREMKKNTKKRLRKLRRTKKLGKLKRQRIFRGKKYSKLRISGIKEYKESISEDYLKSTRYRKYYVFFFIISLFMSAISIMYKEWLSLATSLLIMLLSIIFYGKKRKIKNARFVFGIYFIIWFAGALLAGFSIYSKKNTSSIIALSVMFFCSAIAGAINSSLKENSMVEMIRKMQMKSHKYETNLDKLMIVLKNNKKAKLSVLAKGFNVKKEDVEEWAHILEEHGLLKIHYPAIGEPELRIGKREEEKIE